MQTPVLEAVTNNTSTMKSKLMTMARTSILYLPVLRLNRVWEQPGGQAAANPFQRTGTANGGTSTGPSSEGMFIVTTNKLSEDALKRNNVYEEPQGVILGGAQNTQGENYICVDQGIDSAHDGNGNITDTSAPTIIQSLPIELRETQYIVQMDHRLGRITTSGGATSRNRPTQGRIASVGSDQAFSFVDDDNIATYYFGFGSDNQIVINNNMEGDPSTRDNPFEKWEDGQVFKGPVGTKIMFRVRASLNLQSGAALFSKLGSGTANLKIRNHDNSADLATSFKFIDSIIRVTGVTTGYSIDIPIRYVRAES
jgi:hypothetical protein